MRRKTQLAIGVLALIMAIAVVTALIPYLQSIGNHGRVVGVNIKVYKDAACTDPLTDIDWGFIRAGETYNRIGYLKNYSNVNVALNMTTTEWNPVTTYLGLIWDAEGKVMTPSSVLPIAMTLVVSPVATGLDAFSFTTVITASG